MYPAGISYYHLISSRVRYLFAALLLAIFFSGQAASAAPTSAEEAISIVQHWLVGDAIPLGTVLPHQVTGVTPYGNVAAPLYYAVALSPTGYVIVAGDDRIEPIIAFVPHGSYDPSPTCTMGALVSRDLPNRLAQVQRAGDCLNTLQYAAESCHARATEVGGAAGDGQHADEGRHPLGQ